MAEKHWKFRKPPDGYNKNQLMQCLLPSPCLFADKCSNAHSLEELNEWKERLLLEENFYSTRQGAAFSEICTEQSYRQELLQKLDDANNEVTEEKTIVAEIISDFIILCDENLYIMHLDCGKELSWLFSIKSTKKAANRYLKRVFFLHKSEEFKLMYVLFRKHGKKVCTEIPNGVDVWENVNREHQDIGILIKFNASRYGNYNQEVVFDFGGYPKALKKLGVQVASEESLTQIMKFDPQKKENNELAWLKEYPIKLLDGTVCAGIETIQYPLPPNIESLVKFDAFKHLDIRLTRDNYKQRLHTLLYIEEYQRRANLQSITFYLEDFRPCLLDLQESKRKGERTAVVTFPLEVMGELAKNVGKSGKALLRVNKHATRSGAVSTPKVFEVVVLNFINDSIYFQLSDELHGIVQNSAIPVDIDVCFRLIDVFQPMHKAIDNVRLDLLFPRSTTDGQTLPEKTNQTIEHPVKLSIEQSNAVQIILSSINPAPPILLLGPFGAGKTLTIAKSVEMTVNQNLHNGTKNKVLICTHSNSAADLYIENYFHPKHKRKGNSERQSYLMTPLRINWEHRYTSTVSDKVLAYCLQDLDTGLFAVPTKEDLDQHSIIICTLVSSEMLYNLKLPEGYFTHIFIDEAAQAMEVEALVPLMLASPQTKVVLAGDHLQMGESVSSTIAKNLGLEKSLLERLFEYYPFNARYKLMLLENFRSYREIVKLASFMFYGDSLLSNKDRGSAPFPIEFYGTEGVEILSTETPSYQNDEEALQVVKIIQSLQEKRDDNHLLSSICVVAFYPAQVRLIRKKLRDNGMRQVRVESVHNIQGLEFDILIISTVRTNSKSTEADNKMRKDMGFLTDSKLLNTAITRARYQLIFVGDPNSLCLHGDCQTYWRFILRYCETNGTLNFRNSYKELVECLETSIASAALKEKAVISEDMVLKRFSEEHPNAPYNQELYRLLQAPPQHNQSRGPSKSTESPSPGSLSTPEEHSTDRIAQRVVGTPDKQYTQSANIPSNHQRTESSLYPVQSFMHPQSEVPVNFVQPVMIVPSGTGLRQYFPSCHYISDQPQQFQPQFHQPTQQQYINSFPYIPQQYPQQQVFLRPSFYPVTPQQYPTLIQHGPLVATRGNNGIQTTSVDGETLSSPRVTTGTTATTTSKQTKSPPILTQNIPSVNSPENIPRTLSPLCKSKVDNKTNYELDRMFTFVDEPFSLRSSNTACSSWSGFPVKLSTSSMSTGDNTVTKEENYIQSKESNERTLQYAELLQKLHVSDECTLHSSQQLIEREGILPRKPILYSAENSQDLQHKITFIHDYCMEVLKYIKAKGAMIAYIKKSTVDAVHDLECISELDVEMSSKLKFQIEMKVETCYTFVHDQLSEWKKNGFAEWSIAKSASICNLYNNVKGKVLDVERFLTREVNECFLTYETSNNTKLGALLQKSKNQLDTLIFIYHLITQELNACDKLLKSSEEIFLDIKLNFLLKELIKVEELQEKYLKNMKLASLQRDKTVPETGSETNMEGMRAVAHDMTEDSEVEEWLTSQRSDPCVREYHTSYERRFAPRLPSPKP